MPAITSLSPTQREPRGTDYNDAVTRVGLRFRGLSVIQASWYEIAVKTNLNVLDSRGTLVTDARHCGLFFLEG